MNTDPTELQALFETPADMGAPCVIKAVDVWKIYRMGDVAVLEGAGLTEGGGGRGQVVEDLAVQANSQVVRSFAELIRSLGR
mgnify:CR=1 FL=1